MNRLLLILFLFTFGAIKAQVLKLDSLDSFVASKYYTSLDDNVSLLSGFNVNDLNGIREIVHFVKSDSICSNLNKAIEQPQTCTRLDLKGQTHLKYCKGIDVLKNLEYLNISAVFTAKWGNYIREIPHGVYELNDLKILIADRSNLKLISHEIENLQDLEYLSLKNGRLTEVPKEIGDLKKLVALDLSFNQITLLPDNFRNLNNLKYLNLAGNSFINSIDKELKNLSNLEFLSIEFANENEDDFESTINAISKLPNLKVLHLRNSYVKTLPDSFKDFKNLKQLSLRGNFDLNLSQTFEVLSNIDSLEILDLSFSRIESLPDDIGKMTNLKTLYIGNFEWCCPMIHFHGGSPNNRVTKLPSSAKSLKSLQNLYLWTWDITDKEKKAITKLLPNTKIEFETKQIDLDEEFKEKE